MQKVVNRVVYLNVDHVPPSEIPNYVESCKAVFETDNPGLDSLKKECIWEDFFIPIRSGDTRVEILVVSPEEREVQRTKLAEAVLDLTPHVVRS